MVSTDDASKPWRRSIFGTFIRESRRNVATFKPFAVLVRPGRPFGVAFGYSLKENSLESLAKNWMEINQEIGVVNNWVNLIAVLGEGLILVGRTKDDGSSEPLLETDALVNFTLAAQEGKNDGNVHVMPLVFGEDTLLYFYFYLSALLARTQIAPVDIGRYVDPNLSPIIHSVL